MEQSVNETSNVHETVKEILDTKSGCPQNDETWKDNSEEIQKSDEGYEGDMEGDGELMPPPSTVP